MTMWTIQEFCNAANTYGVQAVKLIAPPPATPASCDTSVAQGAAGANVILTGTAVSGSGFYDPGVGFSNRISAAVGGAGVTVNSITYTDSTHITLNVSVTGGATPGARTVTVTNPDGQAVASGAGILTVTASITAAPTATTLPPTMQSNTVATLNASVNPNSQATAAWFEWGLTANNYINHTATNTLGSGGATLAISNSLTGLTPRVVYHGRVVATNASGLVHGSDVSFGSPAVVLNGAAMLTIPVSTQSLNTLPNACAAGVEAAVTCEFFLL